MLKPKILQLEITNDCNRNCSICMRRVSTRDVGHLSKDDFEKIPLERFKEVAFHGWGEPFLHPDLFEFVKRAKELGVKTSLITNGTLLIDRMDELINSDLDSIAFGIFKTDESVFSNVREFCKRNEEIKTFVDVTILPWNLDEIKKIVQFAGECGINVVLHRLFHVHLGIGPLSKDTVKKACKIAKEIGNDYGIKVYCPPKSKRPCVVALSCIFLGYDLTASPCCFLHEMGYHYTSLSFEQHLKFIKGMKRNDVCKQCPW